MSSFRGQATRQRIRTRRLFMKVKHHILSPTTQLHSLYFLLQQNCVSTLTETHEADMLITRVILKLPEWLCCYLQLFSYRVS